MNFLIVTLECKQRDEVLELANQAVAEDPDYRAIVSTWIGFTFFNTKGNIDSGVPDTLRKILPHRSLSDFN